MADNENVNTGDETQNVNIDTVLGGTVLGDKTDGTGGDDKTPTSGTVDDKNADDKTLIGAAADDKGDDDKSGDDKSGDEDNKPGDKAPESYEDFTMPEGVELNKDLTSKFSVLAKEFNLSQEDAQKIIDLASEQAQNFGEKNIADVKEAKKVWEEETRNDEELGGANIKENMSIALKALDHFGSETLRKMFNETGLGNHPEMIRFAYKVGKAMSEDTIITGPGKGNGAAPKSAAEIMYPNNA